MASHPYYPTDIELPGFVPPLLRFDYILGVFFSAFIALFLTTWLVSGRFSISLKERLLTCWFMCTGVIHLVVEGTVVANKNFYKDTSGNILNEIWKEYAKADSRYATRDAFVIQMEAVTAFVEGPACFLVVAALLYRLPWRYVAVMLVSLGQLYGDVLYFATCYHEGWDKHSRPEALYFWFYFVIINAVWLVVPSMCIVWAARRVNAAVASADKKSKTA